MGRDGDRREGVEIGGLPGGLDGLQLAFQQLAPLLGQRAAAPGVLQIGRQPHHLLLKRVALAQQIGQVGGGRGQGVGAGPLGAPLRLQLAEPHLQIGDPVPAVQQGFAQHVTLRRRASADPVGVGELLFQ